MKSPLVPPALRHCFNYVRFYGVARTLRSAFPYLKETLLGAEQRTEREDEFDRKFGTDTSSSIYPWDLPSLAAGGRDIHGYEPLAARALREIIATLPLERSSFTFIDLGSGKGRALLIASEFGFARIVGVELASELHTIARRNVELYRPQAQPCRNFELQQGDAAEYRFPEGPLVLFMYSPFGRATLLRVLDNLASSLARAPRSVFVVYVNPEYDSLLGEMSALSKLPTPSWYALYESRGAGAGRASPNLG